MIWLPVEIQVEGTGSYQIARLNLFFWNINPYAYHIVDLFWVTRSMQ